jgi:hypothetical protein
MDFVSLVSWDCLNMEKNVHLRKAILIRPILIYEAIIREDAVWSIVMVN